MTPLPSTLYSAPPHFRWLIILYFFVGGIAGGALVLGALLRLGGVAADRPVARLAAYVALIGAVVSGLLLIIDLGVPLRFWHMVIQSNTGAIMFKWWSPMSVGVWILLAFGFFALLAALGSLMEANTLRWRLTRRLAASPVMVLVAVGGILAGLLLAGYTGVLLAVTNRPIWADSTWLGALFLLSGGSSAAATLRLLARWRHIDVAPTMAWLVRFDWLVLLLELVVLVVFLLSLGPMWRAFLNGWGLLLVIGVIGLGLLAPLVLERRALWGPVAPDESRRTAARGPLVSAAFTAAVLVLVGGFLLRVVMLLASEQIHVAGTQVVR